MNAHPSIGEAWRCRRVGGPQVAVLAATHAIRRIRDALPYVVESLLANAEEMCFEGFAGTVEHFVALADADADGAHDQRDDAIEHRSAAVNEVGHTLDVRVFGGDGVTTDEVIGIRGERRDRCAHVRPDPGRRRPGPDLGRWFPGRPVHPHEVLRAVPVGHVRRVVLDADGHVVDFGRTKRLFEGAARQAAKLLVRHFHHPGCDLPAGWSDVDHDIEWGDDGRTDQSNAGVLCRSHNIAKHRLQLRRRRADNGIDDTVRPDGTVILPVGTRTPRFDPDVDPPDDPDEIRRRQHMARQRLRACCREPAA
ncbi:MAG: HNH endonuclease signature motif containing protein [Ilumatobacter sp.]|uniref:HNH endonuclease signature motif containing protein n=1 Tax=Ilumatobacter sp. TaxID=1967498 RepID=UPI003296DD64